MSFLCRMCNEVKQIGWDKTCNKCIEDTEHKQTLERIAKNNSNNLTLERAMGICAMHGYSVIKNN